VGIARVLAANPDVLLMDEPLGWLDAISRNVLQGELAHIWGRTSRLFSSSPIASRRHSCRGSRPPDDRPAGVCAGAIRRPLFQASIAQATTPSRVRYRIWE